MTSSQYEKKLKIYETWAIRHSDPFTGFESNSFTLLSGSRLVFTLNILSIDLGAQVDVTIKNSFSVDADKETVLSFSSNSAGMIKRVLSDFHQLFDIEFNVTGGNATFYFGVSVFDNAMVTRIENAVIEVALSHITGVDGKFDSVRIGDGTDSLGINPDGSINVNIIQSDPTQPEVTTNEYDEAIAVPSGAETLVVSYTVPPDIIGLLQKIEFTGENIARFTVYINGSKVARKRTHHGSGLSGQFEFIGGSEEGIPMVEDDVVELKVLHNRPYSGNFEGRIQVLEKA